MDDTKTPHVVQDSSALADVALSLSDRVRQTTRTSPCFDLELQSVQLLSLTLLCCWSYYKQSIPVRPTGHRVLTEPGPAETAGNPDRIIAYAQAVQPKLLVTQYLQPDLRSYLAQP
jgi:hypothetical protein